MAEIDHLLEPGEAWQGSPAGHPDEESWERLACGELDESQRLELVDHVVACGDCGRIYRALVEIEAGAREIGGAPSQPSVALAPAPSPVPARRWRYAVAGGLAAAAALVFVLVGVRPTPPPAPAPAPPTVAPSVRSPTPITVALIAPLGAQRAAPTQFRWEPVPGAVGYRLELLDAGGERIASREVTAPLAAWPETAPRTAGLYYWRVVGLLERGGSVDSELADFEIAGASD